MQFGVLEGKTAGGRATIVELRINYPDMATIRQLFRKCLVRHEGRRTIGVALSVVVPK